MCIAELQLYTERGARPLGCPEKGWCGLITAGPRVLARFCPRCLLDVPEQSKQTVNFILHIRCVDERLLPCASCFLSGPRVSSLATPSKQP